MKREIAYGAAWMLLYKLVDRGLGAVSTVILARLLIPADFGLVAMAMSVIAIVELLTAFSFEIALIQRPQLERAHYDTAWTLDSVLYLLAAAVVAAASSPTAALYGEPRLVAVMLVLAAGLSIRGLANPGVVDFRRLLDFQREFALMASRRAFAFVLTLTLALAWRSYWALIAGTVADGAFGVLLSYLMHPYRPRPSLLAWRELMAFSGWMVVNNWIATFEEKIGHFVIGRQLGAGPLGFYTLGAEIAQIPSADLIAPINRAVYPGYARIATDRHRLRETFLDVVGVIMLCAVPAAFGIAAIAEPLVRVALGQKWLDTAPVIQVMAIAAGIAAATSNNATVYLALGKPHWLTAIRALRLLLLPPLAVALVARFGIVGAAYAALLVSAAALAASVPLLLARLRLSWIGYCARLWRPLVASTTMWYAVDRTIHAWSLDTLETAASALAAGIAVGVVCYIALVGLLWVAARRPDGAERALLAWVRGRFRKAT